jgi:hypothetical protein
MGGFPDTDSGEQELEIEALSPETREALSRSAQLNGRSVHEEAEHIIKNHLSALCGGGN